MRIKKGDTVPLRVTLEWEDGTAIDLSSATSVNFVMKLWRETTSDVDAVCVVIDASNGIVEYQWVAGETDVVGLYGIEFVITYSDGTIYTVPSNGELWLYIMNDLE